MEFRGIKARNGRYDKVEAQIIGAINSLSYQPLIAIHTFDAEMNKSTEAFVDLATAKKIGAHLIKLAGEGK